MPRRAKGPRLYLDRKRRQWIIRDGKNFIRTGRAETDIGGAEQALSAYLGAKYKPAPSAEPSIAEILAAYLQEKVPHLRTERNIKYNIRSLEKWWGDKKLSDVNARNCRAYAETKTPSAARVDLLKLGAAVKYWHKEYGPLAAVPQITLPSASPARERWLSRSEAARLLWCARRTSHLSRFIMIAIYTGSRPGVVKTLEWDWIDFNVGTMRRRGLNEAERDTKRRPTVKLGRRILAHLRRWHRLDAGRVKWIVHYNGKPIDDPHSAWKRATKKAGLVGVSPHTLRHTRATWLMQAGVSLWEAAGALGMSVRTLEQTYAHHHPSYQENAAKV